MPGPFLALAGLGALEVRTDGAPCSRCCIGSADIMKTVIGLSQLALAPVLVLSIWIEDPFDVTVSAPS
jgi:hypothetical protein